MPENINYNYIENFSLLKLEGVGYVVKLVASKTIHQHMLLAHR